VPPYRSRRRIGHAAVLGVGRGGVGCWPRRRWLGRDSGGRAEVAVAKTQDKGVEETAAASVLAAVAETVAETPLCNVPIYLAIY
jgi:hypothetical protein